LLDSLLQEKALAFWLSNEWGGGDAVFFAQVE